MTSSPKIYHNDHLLNLSSACSCRYHCSITRNLSNLKEALNDIKTKRLRRRLHRRPYTKTCCCRCLTWLGMFGSLNSILLRAPRCNEYGGNFLAKRKPGSCHRGSLLPHGLLSTTRLRPWKKANQTRFKIPFKQTICSLVLDVE